MTGVRQLRARLYRLELRHLAWRWTGALTAGTVVLAWLLRDAGPPAGTMQIPWWALLVPLLAVMQWGTVTASGGSNVRVIDAAPVATLLMVETLSPLATVGTYLLASFIAGLVMRRRAFIKKAFNAAVSAFQLIATSGLVHLLLDGRDVTSGYGVLALGIAVPVVSVGQMVLMIVFFRQLTRGLDDGAEFLARLTQLAGLAAVQASLAVCYLMAIRVAREDSVLGWSVPFVGLLGFLLMALTSRRQMLTGERAAERTWLDAVRGESATQDLAALAASVAVGTRATAVRLEIGGRYVTHGELPAEALAELVARRAAEPTGSATRLSIGDRMSGVPALAQAPITSPGMDGWLVVCATSMLTEDGPSLEVRVRDAAKELSQAFERDHTRTHLEHAAAHDGLTNLLRAGSFIHRLDEELAAGRQLTVLLVETGGLRHVNDLFGREAGDEVLRQLARRLLDALPGRALTSRLGGHLFAAAFQGDDRDRAEQIADLVYRALARPVLTDGNRLDVRLTLGIALAPVHGTAATDLLRRAELALDEAEAAHARSGFFEWGQEDLAQRRLRLVPDLRDALARGDVTAVYQPQVSPHDQRILGVEALARWTHPTLGFIPPDEFVGLAETSGLVRPLTTAILGDALKQHRAWAEEGIVVPVSVNLSAISLMDPHLVADVRGLLEESQVAAEHLTLEVTETSVMDQPDSAIAVLRDLRALGVRISLDDFGTGHSSLAYLKELPADEVKLDRAFTMELADERNVALVRASVQLAHALNLSMVAEGVEDDAALARLRELDVDVAQGYYICRPQPAAAVRAWMLDRRDRLTIAA